MPTGAKRVSEIVWRGYCDLKVQPANNVGAKKWAGAALYVVFFAIACVLCAQWFLDKDAATFTTLEKILQSPKRTPTHRFPDLIVCPSQREDQKYKYNAAYFDGIIDEVLAMPPEDVDDLAGMIYDNCPPNKGCEPLDRKCESTKFAKYCEILEVKLLGGEKPQYPGMTFKLRRAILEAQKKKEGKMSLQTLFGSLLMLRHMAGPFLNLTDQEIQAELVYTDAMNEASWMYKRFAFPICHFYDYEVKGIYDRKRNAECESATDMVWISNSLCTLNLGHAIDQFSGPFAGFEILGDTGAGKWDAAKLMQADYWLGNLDVTTVEENQFITNFPVPGHGKQRSRISGVVHYRMIKLNDEANLGKSCAPQSIIRGLKLPCRGEADNIWWYYIFNFQKRPIHTVWIYPKSLDFFTRKPAFTNYSRFQLAVGIFGCMVGLSLMQLVEFLSLLLIWLKPSMKKVIEIVQVVAVSALIGLCIYMSFTDIKSFIGSRYASESFVQDSQFPIPNMKLCNNPTFDIPSPSFINLTKIRDHDVSPALYHYLLQSVWRQSASPVSPYPTRPYNESGIIYKEFPQWMFTNWNPKPQLPWPCTIDYRRYYYGPRPTRCYFPTNPLRMKLINFKFTKTGNVTQKESEDYFDTLHNEARILYQKMGFGNRRPSFYEIFDYFNLDFARLIRTCEIGPHRIPKCAKYARYVIDGETSGMCIQISVPKAAVPVGTTLLGLSNSLKITFDTEIYRKDSDINRYVGPRLDDLIERNKYDTKCSFLLDGKMKTFNLAYETSNQFNRTDYIDTIGLNALRYFKTCGISTSWLLHLSHPLWAATNIELRIDPNGLSYRNHYAVDISDGIEQDIERDGKECFAAEAMECADPIGTISNLVRSMLHQKMCNCTGCFYKDAETEKFLADILPNQKCCTPEEHWRCVLSMQARLRWNQTSRQYEDFVEPANKRTAILVEKQGAPKVEIPADRKEMREMSIQKLGEKFFADTGPPDTETMRRLQKAIIKCSQTPCLRKFVVLNSLQAMDTVPGEWTVRIFYGKDKVVGRRDVDVLEPTSAIAVFICGYSVTFGISVLGIVHIIVTSMYGRGSHMPVSFESVMSRFHSYWLRTMGAVLVTRRTEAQATRGMETANQNAGNTGNQNEGNTTDQIEENTASHITVHRNRTKEDDTVFIEENPGERQGPVKAMLKVPGRENPQSQSTGSPEEPSSSNTRITVGAPTKIGHGIGGSDLQTQPKLVVSPPSSEETEMRPASNQFNQPQSETNSLFESQIMLTVLAIIILLILTLIFLFNFLTDFYTFSADVETLPTYQRPSLFLCGRNAAEFDVLTKALDAGECRLKSDNQMIIHGCKNIFKTLMKTKYGKLCWLFDNSNQWHRLTDIKEYLTLTIPKTIDLLYDVASLNGSSLETFEPFQKWERSSMLIDFTIRQRKLIKNCHREVKRDRCDECPLDATVIATASACCTQQDMLAPAFAKGLPCEQFEFALGITLEKNDPKQKMKTLSLRPADLSMVVLAEKPKHNFYSIFSIIGGLMGAFLGLDLLNIVSATLFSLAGRMRWPKSPRGGSVHP